MKLVLILLSVMGIRFFSDNYMNDDFIDPTGTYILKGKVVDKKIISHSGEIRVKLLNDKTIAICFYIAKGYPDYKSGSFLDTLLYKDNQVSYSKPGCEDCRILICFNHKTAETQQLYKNPNSDCGFEKGVMASAIFEKSSVEKPIIQNLSAHGTGQ